MIALVVFVGAAVAFVVTPASNGSRPPLYKATHVLIVSPQNAIANASAGRNNTSLTSFAALVQGSDVAKRVAAKVGYKGAPDGLLRFISVLANPETSTVSITATTRDKAEATLLADTFGTEVLAYVSETTAATRQEETVKAQQRMDALQQQVAQLDGRLAVATIAQAGVLQAQRDAIVRQFSVAYERYQQLAADSSTAPALTTLRPASATRADRGLRPPESREGRMALAGMLGLVLGSGLALLAEAVDARVRTKEQAEAAYGVPVLAEIPPLPFAARRKIQVLIATAPSSLAAESYRALRTSLMLMRTPSGSGAWAEADEHRPNGGGHLIMVSSANPGEGKTTTVVNLAASFAEAGSSVLVIDCDFRHPKAGRYLRVSEGPGLSDVFLRDGGPTGLRDVAEKSIIPNVRLITTGQTVPNPSEVFSRGASLIASARALADVVILDTPPILTINDPSELIPIVDDVVLVCRSSRTTSAVAERASELMARLGGPLRGVVLVGAEDVPKQGYYYYYAADSPTGLRGLLHRFRGGVPAGGSNKKPMPRQSGGGNAKQRKAPLPPKAKGQQPRPAKAPKAPKAQPPQKVQPQKAQQQKEQQQAQPAPAPAPPVPPKSAPPAPRPPAATVGQTSPSPSPSPSAPPQPQRRPAHAPPEPSPFAPDQQRNSGRWPAPEVHPVKSPDKVTLEDPAEVWLEPDAVTDGPGSTSPSNGGGGQGPRSS